MSDFVADLERELVAAARRRATRRRVVLVPRLRPATVLAVVAVVAMLVVAAAVVRGLEDGSRPGDERPQVPPPSGPAFALPAAPVAEPCPGVEQREEDDVIQHPLSIFARPRTAADAVPALAGADSFAWIRAGTIHRVGARRAAPDRFDAEVYLVPAAEPRRGGACDGHREAMLAVCLVAVGEETFVRCFSELEVEGGRAVAVTPAGVAYGVVPDRVERVTLGAPGETVSANVHDNAFELPIAAKAGDQVRMELARVRQCPPSDELLDAVPALRDGDWVTLPTAADEALPSGRGMPRWARPDRERRRARAVGPRPLRRRRASLRDRRPRRQLGREAVRYGARAPRARLVVVLPGRRQPRSGRHRAARNARGTGRRGRAGARPDDHRRRVRRPPPGHVPAARRSGRGSHARAVSALAASNRARLFRRRTAAG